MLPGKDKLAAVRQARAPKDVHQVRQILGLLNFFRAHVQNLSMDASPLTQLTRKDTPWCSGPLLPVALKAFTELKLILCLQPLVAYPQPNHPFALIVDAAAGVTKVNSKGERTFRQEWGLGAILGQPDHTGQLQVVAYASRTLSLHTRKTIPPFYSKWWHAPWELITLRCTFGDKNL